MASQSDKTNHFNSYAMYMFGAINIVLVIFVWYLIPETKGVALENMDAIFGGADHTQQGIDMIDEKATAAAVNVEYAGYEAKQQQKQQDGTV